MKVKMKNGISQEQFMKGTYGTLSVPFEGEYEYIKNHTMDATPIENGGITIHNILGEEDFYLSYDADDFKALFEEVKEDDIPSPKQATKMIQTMDDIDVDSQLGKLLICAIAKISALETHYMGVFPPEPDRVLKELVDVVDMVK